MNEHSMKNSITKINIYTLANSEQTWIQVNDATNNIIRQVIK